MQVYSDSGERKASTMASYQARRLTLRRTLSLVMLSVTTGLGGLTLLAGLDSAVATATTPTTTSLNGTAAVTVDGSSWNLGASWQQESTSAASLVVGLERTVTAGGAGYEEHSWTVPVTASTLAFNSTSGVGTLNTGTQTSPLATVNLKFNAISHTSATCVTGSETVYDGTLSGNLTLVTGLTNGGTVGGKTVSFTSATPTITVDADCVASETSPCTASIFFNSGSSDAAPSSFGFSEKVTGKAVGSVGVESTTVLSSPTGASRQDAGSLIGATPPKYTAKTKTLAVTSSSSGIVTGSATLTGSKPSVTKIPCTVGTKQYTLTETFDTGAAYASPAGKSLTATLELGSTLIAPASTTSGTYEVATLKAA